jgi:sugar/nucleoside kinase (ribokinase family)
LSKSGRILILGDLGIDFVTSADNSPQYSAWPSADTTLIGSPEVRIGGSAFLFARAVANESNWEPEILAPCGPDVAGSIMQEEMKSSGFTTRGIQVASGGSTFVNSSTYLPDGKRLMVRPSRVFLAKLDPDRVSSYLNTLNPVTYKLVFLSGYLLANRDEASIESIRRVFGWARDHSIATLVDLVPHEFHAFVGTIADVSKVTGPVSGFISALETARDLGLCDPFETTSEAIQQLPIAASALALLGRFGIVQHRVTPEAFAQAYAENEGTSTMQNHEFDPQEMIGLGDVLALKVILKSQLL